MKILFLNAGAELGGAERSLLDLIASLRESNPEIELHVAVSADGPLVEQVRRRGVDCTILPMPAALLALGDSGLREGGAFRFLTRVPAAILGTWRYVGELSRLVAAMRPDVIHSNSIKFHLITGMIRRSNALVVWHIRDFLGGRRLVSRALRWTRGAHGALAISRAVAEDAGAVLPRVPIETVYNAIDVDHFCPGTGLGSRLDKEAGLSPAGAGVIRIGLVATYARWKGQDVFLDAAARIAKDFSTDVVRFYVVGGPIYQTHGSQWSLRELHERAATAGPGRVGFIGFQADTREIYRSLDIVVHASSRPEPFGRTVVEAMACGRAIILANAGGTAELYTEGHDAIGASPGDAELLAEGMRKLIVDPDLRLTLGKNARESAVRRFARSRLGSQVVAAYGQFKDSGMRFHRS